jgi:hypothetical protein
MEYTNDTVVFKKMNQSKLKGYNLFIKKKMEALKNNNRMTSSEKMELIEKIWSI